MAMALPREELLARLSACPPLVEGLLDIKEQVQGNGIDLTLRQIDAFLSPGRLGFDNALRLLPESRPVEFGPEGSLPLEPGCYLVTYNEVVHLPRDLIALGFPRSSLLRCGVSLHTALWDAGYSGRSRSLLVVHNPYGFTLARNARLMQLVFFQLKGETQEGYHGLFQGENL